MEVAGIVTGGGSDEAACHHSPLLWHNDGVFKKGETAQGGDKVGQEECAARRPWEVWRNRSGEWDACRPKMERILDLPIGLDFYDVFEIADMFEDCDQARAYAKKLNADPERFERERAKKKSPEYEPVQAGERHWYVYYGGHLVGRIERTDLGYQAQSSLLIETATYQCWSKAMNCVIANDAVLAGARQTPVIKKVSFGRRWNRSGIAGYNGS